VGSGAGTPAAGAPRAGAWRHPVGGVPVRDHGSPGVPTSGRDHRGDPRSRSRSEPKRNEVGVRPRLSAGRGD